MTPERWQQVERIYHAVLARPAAERAPALVELCGVDEGLRREVETLLAQAGASAFLETPAVVDLASGGLRVGQRVGPYVVGQPLGSGGMGEVYRARDEQLGREVALKILPDAFRTDPERRGRLEREARVLAALNHPHIGAIYGLEAIPVPGSGISPGRVLVLELVEGPTLAERLAEGPLPLTESLTLALQIAEALEAAHETGIVHRDLKPANIKITPSGAVKVLDFGLAKLTGAASSAHGDRAPTITVDGTRPGLIIGTAAYMSPEQARGLPVDKRTDIWAFGCVLYEMLTGRRAFEGEDHAAVLARVLERDPDLSLLPAATPPAIRRLLRRCLEKDRKRRLPDIAAARLEIEDAQSEPDATSSSVVVRDRLSSPEPGAIATPRSRSRRLALALLTVALAGVVLLGYVVGMRRGRPAPQLVLRTNIALPPGVTLAPFNEFSGPTLALSPDGTRIVLVGERNGRTQLYVRQLDQVEARPVAGTEGARGPFFSPDGQRMGFWADGRLMKIPLTAGGASFICDATAESGAAWMPDDTIVFSTGVVGLLRVSAEGGRPQALTTPDASKGEYAHIWPSKLPNANAMLFSITYNGGAPQAGSVGLLSLDSRRWTTLVTGAVEPKFVAPGFLIVNRGGALEAAPFDARLALSGPFVPVEESTGQAGSERLVSFDVSVSGGSLVYAAAQSATEERGIYAVDVHGQAESMTEDRKPYWGPAVSPDGTRLAANVLIDARVSEIWVLDLVRRTWQRLTTSGNDWSPVWKDGRTLIYTSGRQGGSATWDEYSLPVTGSDAPALIASFPHQISQHALSPDRREAIFQVPGASSQDLWLQSFDRPAAARPFLATPANEGTNSQSFSPDGHWLAYWSDATGRYEVYVTDFPGGRQRARVSTAGGIFACWARDGRQIFYWQGKTMMAATVRTSGGFEADAPRALFDSPVTAFNEFDVAPDGSRFYFAGSEPHPATSQIVFVPDLAAALQSKSQTP